ncbi:hypothetical protein ACA910_000592 [Epithemia clementina (nom. ined.)]
MSSYGVNNNNTGSNEISSDASKRICDHMNTDHGETIYVMATKVVKVKPGWHVSGARIQSVSLKTCRLQVFVCCGDLCEMTIAEYPFRPPLQSSSEVRKRMISVHHEVMSPKFYWLLSKPTAFIIVLVGSIVAYGVLFMGVSRMESTIENNAQVLAHNLANVFGSTRMFVEVLRFLFWLLVVIHCGEGLFAVYHCRSTLKLGLQQQIMWFILLFCAGFPIMSEFKILLEAVASTKDSKAA